MRFVLFLLFIVGSFSASAKIHIEPYLGYSLTYFSSSDLTAKGVIDQATAKLKQVATEKIQTTIRQEKNQASLLERLTKDFTQGATGGLRIGYRSLGLGLGVDLSVGQWFSSEHKILPVTGGFFASYNLPLLFRVYGTLLPQAYLNFSEKPQQANAQKSNSYPLRCTSAGLKVGASYLTIPFLSINIEYQGLKGYKSNNSLCAVSTHTATAFVNFIF